MQPTAGMDDFARLDIRVGRIVSAEPFPEARKPAYRLRVDFGPEIGIRASSAQITQAYAVGKLTGRLVLGVVNLPPRRIAGFQSEVLVLGVYSSGGEGPVVLIAPDALPCVCPGDRLG